MKSKRRLKFKTRKLRSSSSKNNKNNKIKINKLVDNSNRNRLFRTTIIRVLNKNNKLKQRTVIVKPINRVAINNLNKK
jgi:hypothetical protein